MPLRTQNERLAHSIALQANGLQDLVSYLLRMYEVEEDEVAVLVLDRKGENLHFVAPLYLARLRAVIPYRAELSLAGRSLKQGKIVAENQLPFVNHLKFFEQVICGNPRPRPLEKMLTVPIFVGNTPLGVVQISRKKIAGVAIPDFRPDDAVHILEIERVIAGLLKGIQTLLFRRPELERPDGWEERAVENRTIPIRSTSKKSHGSS